MSWELPTATSVYRVGMAADGCGLVLQSWADPDQPAWPERERAGFAIPADDLRLEYSALGTRQLSAADLIVDHGNGLVGARLVWEQEADLVNDGGTAVLTARALDTTENLHVELRIWTSRSHDVVRKRARISNRGSGPITLPRVFSPSWELPMGPGAVVDVLAGEWAREFQPHRVDLAVGELSIGSRQGITSHSYSPVVTVTARPVPDRIADPIAGPTPEPAQQPAYGFALAWSGSWRMAVEAPPLRARVRISGGVDDEAGVVRLDPGETFETPDVLGVRAPDGPTGVRRRWHDYQRSELARGIDPGHRPVVYNSWYATGFDVDPESQRRLAERAAGLGVEAFVVDDGWFAGRTSDRAGLGDWVPDPARFPSGLDPLITDVVARGMRFGIWVEPEAVNPDSDLFRRHPDWVYRAGDRPLLTIRHQYVLDFGRTDVVAWAKQALRQLLADSRISYLKWDMNRPVTDGGRPGDSHGRQWSVSHTRGYYDVMAMLRREFPHVTVEACAGGGGRVDLAVLGLSDVVWPSDETGPRDRLAIQHGFLSAYPPHVMSSWVTDEPDRVDVVPTSFEFRFVVAMAGVLGIGADLLQWGDAELARAAELVARYRELRAVVHRGSVETHGSPADPVYAVEYGGGADCGDLSCVLVYARPGRPDTVQVRPRTLAPDRLYRLRGTAVTVTGREAAAGVAVPFGLAADADVLVFEPVR